jgi:hypothetical protein
MIGGIKLIHELYKPWAIQDNDIHSKSIQSWASRQVRESLLDTRSAKRRTHEETLFSEYVASKIQLSNRFRLLNISA